MSSDPEPTPPRLTRAVRWLIRNAYLGVVVAALLLLTRTIEFTPPPQVRIGRTNAGQLVGDAPPQQFASELSNPQALQVRATLRLYPDPELPVAAPDPEIDEHGQILSQPIVTTILGMNASIEQTVRLEDGELEIDVSLHATPRLGPKRRSGTPPPLTLEHEIVVRSRQQAWWRPEIRRRVHIDSRGLLGKIEERGHRIVFAVDEHLFSLDLEIHRPLGAVPSE